MKQSLLRFLFLILFSIVNITIYATSFTVDDITYKTTNNQKVSVCRKSKGQYGGNIIIPSEVYFQGVKYEVEGIDGAAFYNSAIKSIVLPSSIVRIGISAFEGSSQLETVELSDSLKTIGSYAFSGCNSLKSISLPNGTEEIGGATFKGCEKLSSVYLGNSVTDISGETFYGCVNLARITIPNSVKKLDMKAFLECRSLFNMTIEDGSETLRVYSTEGTSYNKLYIKDLYLGRNIKGSFAFFGMYDLQHLTISSSVSEISEEAFSHIGHFDKITIPNSVIKIGDSAFESSSIKNLVIGKNVKEIGYSAFQGSGLSEVTSLNPTPPVINSNSFSSNSVFLTLRVPKGSLDVYKKQKYWNYYKIVEIDVDDEGEYKDSNFVVNNIYYKTLSSKTVSVIKSPSDYSGNIVIPEEVEYNGQKYSVVSIGEDAFRNSIGLSSVKIGNKVETIGLSAFEGCISLVALTIGERVVDISDKAFDDCNSLEKIEFHCETIRAWFRGKESVKTIVIGDGVKSILRGAFKDCYFKSVYIQDLESWCNMDIAFENVSSDMIKTNQSYSMFFSITCTANPLSYADALIVNNKIITDLVLPDNIKKINDCVFWGFKGLTSITLPNNLESIGTGAFKGCENLKSIRFGNNIKTIDKCAFSSCSNLQDVYISNIEAWCNVRFNTFTTAKRWEGIAKVLYEDIDYSSNPLRTANNLYINNDLLTSLIIPESVETINLESFYGVKSITSITIHNPTPIDNVYGSFDNSIYENAILYVPNGSKALYCQHSHWGKFKNIEEINYSYVKYTLTYFVDGEVYKTYKYNEGENITPEPEPTKEGYTFSGWSEIPPTMPAHDVTISGTFSKIKTSQYKSLNDYISESSISKSKDGNSCEITPHIKKIKKIYVDLRESTTNSLYCFLNIYNEKETKSLDISSKGLSTTTLHNITVNRSNTNIAKHANSKTYDWLYYNPNNKNEVIIDVEQFLGELGVIKSWQVNFGTSCIVNIEKEGSPEESNSAEAVDLGLSVKWASCNLGADKPEGFGDYYSWGETITKTDYSWETYLWGNPPSKYNNTDGLKKLEDSDDVVRKLWGGYWRMPTHEEEVELYNNCTWEYTIVNNINGFKVIGRNGNSIFLPYAGLYDGDNKVSLVNTGGWYWSSEIYNEHFATGFYFWGNSRSININSHDRCDGHVIRPVFDEGQSSNINNPFNRTKDNVIYNLNGQRLQNPQRGINIINGKKVVIK